MRLPKLCCHKATSRAFVKLNGRFRYLGEWGSEEARRQYRDICDDLLCQGKRKTITHLTVDQLRVGFLAHGKAYYVDPTGKPTGETNNIREAIQFLDPWQDEPAAQFGPRKLKAARHAVPDRSFQRSTPRARRASGSSTRSRRSEFAELLVPCGLAAWV